MKKALAVLSVVMFVSAASLAVAGPANAQQRITKTINVPAGQTYCPASTFCELYVYAQDQSIWYSYDASFYYSPSMTATVGAVCHADEIDYCYYSPYTQSVGSYTWGGAEFDLHSGGYTEWVDVYEYQSGALTIKVTGTTSGRVTYNGHTITTW